MLSLQELQQRREERGLKIVNDKKNQIKRVNEFAYEVCSQSGNGVYLVSLTEKGWICECPDHKFRGLKCKHVFAVEFSIALRKAVGATKIEPIVDLQICQVCGSKNVVKDGIRHNQSGDIQIYLCKDCDKHFTINLGFERMKSTPQVITSALQLYFSGTSLRNITNFLKLKGVRVSHVAVYKWIKKYVELMDKYLEKIMPNVGDTWRADELWLKIKG
ncbi:MAG: transposase, partial [Candidatus Bathyarchaeia archaeon]